ncbi:MAG: DUF262 domain-containing protein [Methylococcaceae bacterium]|nr:DUF262 domain-containing protein [Methylococcaceae bacterium]
MRDIVEFTNRSYFLPAIQRPFVWKADQVIALFDSLMKGYPISSFLFWEIIPENRENWDIYKFGTTHNECKCSVPLLKKEGLGEILLNKSPSIPLFQRGR